MLPRKVKSLQDLGMTYIQLSPDMQLYIHATQMKWSDSQRLQNLILRPGVMHIVQNVCGCIGHLMKGSGLETLINWRCVWGSRQHHVSGENMGACDACIQDGLFHFTAILPSDRLQDVG